MTDPSDNAASQSPMSVISYAPLEVDRSMNRLFRLAMGWFLICNFGNQLLWSIPRLWSFITDNSLSTISYMQWYHWNECFVDIGKTLACTGLVLSGILLLRRASYFLKIIRVSLWILMVVLFFYSSIDFVVHTTAEWSSITRGKAFETVVNALHVPATIILPLFLLILTSPRIAAIYK